MNATTLGLVAGLLTTACWLPQLARVWRLRRAEEISWGYLGVLGTGIACWLAYGIVTKEIAIILANALTLVLLLVLTALKIYTRGIDRALAGDEVRRVSEIERDGLHLSYERVGEGPPLLLISPLGWSGAHWRLHQVGELAKDFEVITFDHRGTGRSSAPDGPYSTRLLARDVITLLEEIDLVEPVFMVGLHGGGAVLQWVCVEVPDAVRAAVLVASGSGRIDARPVPRALSPEQIAALVEAGWPAFLGTALASREYFVEPAEELVDELLGALSGEDATALRPWLWHVQATLEHELTERIAEIELPCFVLVGEGDDQAPQGSPNRIETSLDLAKRLFYAEYVEIEDAALALHIEQHEAFNAALGDFLIRH